MVRAVRRGLITIYYTLDGSTPTIAFSKTSESTESDTIVYFADLKFAGDELICGSSPDAYGIEQFHKLWEVSAQKWCRKKQRRGKSKVRRQYHFEAQENCYLIKSRPPAVRPEEVRPIRRS
jgi:hypothetical protein